MALQQQIKSELKDAMKAKDIAKKDTIRIIMGEFSRQPQKELSDPEVVAIIRKLIKSETELLAHSKQSVQDSPYIRVLEGYLPAQASEADIKAWIAANIDFSTFGNKMQAMKPIMTQFAGRVDGNMVKKILDSL
ncbi:MAG: GatB/YqeY domain-containing protein [Thiomicrorhabdus sp.]|jgi:uncharacterized protein YqeY|nr:GatB/YqeY domain-containing protein [Thiomicrorhabdus sp.]